MTKAPIALFVYNRPDHTRRTLEFLAKNDQARQSNLYVFSDGPRSEKDESLVLEVREVIKDIEGFNKVEVIEKINNDGLAKSVIQGVTELCNAYGRVIVVEDDLVTSPYFLTYMNDALTTYENDFEVMHVSGYMFPIEEISSLPESFFLRMTSSWGWGTWNSAWNGFDPSAERLLEKIRSAGHQKEFDIGDSIGYTRMLRRQMYGKIDSWAVRWYASVFLKDGLCLFPRESYVLNKGFDGSGVHCSDVDFYDVDLSTKKRVNFPRRIECNERAFELLQDYYKKMRDPLYKKIISRAKKIFRDI